MWSMLFAKTTVLFKFQPIRAVFLIFHAVVVALLAVCAGKGDFYSHYLSPFLAVGYRNKSVRLLPLCRR